MNTDRDPVRARIDAAERMLQQARHEYTRGNAEDAGEFLGAAKRNIDRAGEALAAKTVEVVEADAVKRIAGEVVVDDHLLSPREKGRLELAHRRQEVARAR